MTTVLQKRLKGHVHEFVRFKTTSGDFRWKCNHPDCYAVLDRPRAQGKRTLCTKCHEEQFILDNERMAYANPVCDFCSNDKRAKERLRLRQITEGAIQEVLAETMKENFEEEWGNYVPSTESDALDFGETEYPIPSDDSESRK